MISDSEVSGDPSRELVSSRNLGVSSPEIAISISRDLDLLLPLHALRPCINRGAQHDKMLAQMFGTAGPI